MFESYRVYEFNRNGSRRIVELATLRRGQRLVRRGVAEEALDWDGKTLCYRLKDDMPNLARALGADGYRPGYDGPSNAALTLAEVDAVAGTNFKYGRSRTAGMSEEKRLNRVHPKTHKVLPAEDIVERATAKLQAWARVGPALAEISAMGSQS
jgi:hypothetical protein